MAAAGSSEAAAADRGAWRREEAAPGRRRRRRARRGRARRSPVPGSRGRSGPPALPGPCNDSYARVTVPLCHGDPRGEVRCEPAEPIRGPLTGQRETGMPARRKGPQTSRSLALWGYCWNLSQRRKSSCNLHTVELFTLSDAISRSHTSRQVLLSSLYLPFGAGGGGGEAL